MEKKEISDKINEFYSKLEDIFDNEGILNVGKKLKNFQDDLGDFSQELEDEVNEEKNKEKSDD